MHANGNWKNEKYFVVWVHHNTICLYVLLLLRRWHDNRTYTVYTIHPTKISLLQICPCLCAYCVPDNEYNMFKINFLRWMYSSYIINADATPLTFPSSIHPKPIHQLKRGKSKKWSEIRPQIAAIQKSTNKALKPKALFVIFSLFWIQTMRGVVRDRCSITKR